MKPFTDISPYYDLLMQDVDYQEWVDYVMHLMDRVEIPKGSSLIDLACGTGTSAILLAKAGYSVKGMDYSAEMLDIARNKANKAKLEIDFFQGDIRDFKCIERPKVLTCLFDSMNYLLNENDFYHACLSAYNSLPDSGLFIFDVNTIFALTKYWDQRLEVKEAEGVVSIWKNSYDFVKHYANLSLTLFIPRGKGYRRVDEFHQEKAYPLEDVEKMLGAAGFGKIEMFKHLTLEPPQRNTIRATIVAYKK
jgi:SAM-dependent methyltransferase